MGARLWGYCPGGSDGGGSDGGVGGWVGVGVGLGVGSAARVAVRRQRSKQMARHLLEGGSSEGLDEVAVVIDVERGFLGVDDAVHDDRAHHDGHACFVDHLEHGHVPYNVLVSDGPHRSAASRGPVAARLALHLGEPAVVKDQNRFTWTNLREQERYKAEGRVLGTP